MNKYVYTFSVPPAGAVDVVKREFHYMVNGTAEMIELAMDVVSYEMTLDEDVEVEIYMIDIDDAGNRSPASDVLKFTVVDTVPPPAPAKPDIMDVKEVIVVMEPVMEEPFMEEPVVEEPVMEEPVVEEPVMDEPVEEPVMDEPVVEEPVMDEPVVEEPVMDEPVVEDGADVGGEADTNV